MRTSPPPPPSRCAPTASTRITCETAGSSGATDHELLEHAYLEDRIVVTSNVGDFEKLARARELHAGIVLLERTGLLRQEQIELIRKIAAVIAEHGAMINEALRVGEDGTMTFEIIPPAA